MFHKEVFNSDVATATINLNNCRALIKIAVIRNFTITGHISYTAGYTSYIPYWSYSGLAHTITYTVLLKRIV